MATIAQTIEAAGVDPKWAAEIARQLKAGRGSPTHLCDAGVPTTLAAVLADEIEDVQIPALAARASGRLARLEYAGFSHSIAKILADTISEAQK